MQSQSSQRRASPAQVPAHETTHSPVQTASQETTDSSIPDTTEESTQHVNTNDNPSQQTIETADEDSLLSPGITQPPQFLSADDDPSVKKCWICFSDSTEDTPETSPWRDPCPCALVAHEECLLDWIADTEAPKTGRGGIITPKITCPQCKSEIKLARPRNYVVDAVKLLNRSTARLVMPGGVLVLSTDILYRISFAHGVHSIYRIFGTADANRILQPVLQYWARPPIDFDLAPVDIRDQAISSLTHHLQHWRLYLGLPLITPVILLSRTRWPFSEAILTVLPTLFFAVSPTMPGEVFKFGKWPPSATMAFALLPYIRQAYNLYHERVWGEKERKWKREILPITSQTQTAPERDPVQAVEDAADDETNVFEIRVNGGIFEEWEDVPEGDTPAPAAEAQDAAPAPVVPDNRAQPAPQQQAQERRVSFSPADVAEKIIGALAFPTIAELSGELLRLALPKTWTVSNRTKGLFNEKWGRSLVGGCLFVVLKDALMLYVRWKMAQMHRNRRVLDYDRTKAKART